jgi:predicted Zn-dependent protease
MRRSSVAWAMAAIAGLACTPSVEDERALGEEYARQVEQQVILSRDAALDGYVDSLAASIAAVADPVGREWHFSVIESPELNAFALPGGHVYLNSGIIARAGSMAELAGVLGHEIGHVVLRHSSEQLTKRTKANVVVTLVCSITGWCSSDVAQIAINLGGAALFAKYSRADEAEADSVAVEYLYRVGIDPRGVPGMFRRIAEERQARPDLVSAVLASHPLDEDRITNTLRLTRRWPDDTLSRLRRDDPAFDLVRPSP